MDILRGEHVIGVGFVRRPAFLDQSLLSLGERRKAFLQERIDQFDALLERKGQGVPLSSALVTTFSVARFRLLLPVRHQLPVEVPAGEDAVLVLARPAAQAQDVAIQLVETLGVSHPGGRP